MLSRRRMVATLVGGSAVAAAATQANAGALALDLQTAAVPSFPGPHSILVANIVEAHANHRGALKLVLGLNMRLLADYPDLFDRRLIMTGGIDQVAGQRVQATTKVLKTTVDLRPFAANETAMPQREADTFYRRTAAQIAGEILDERAALLSQGKDLCPCVPIAINGPRMDPETLAPVMAFQTRYGIWDHSWDRNVA